MSAEQEIAMLVGLIGGYIIAAAFCIALHRDRFSLLPPLLIYDFYHGFMLNSAWLIAVIDEVRGAKMRWS